MQNVEAYKTVSYLHNADTGLDIRILDIERMPAPESESECVAADALSVTYPLGTAA